MAKFDVKEYLLTWNEGLNLIGHYVRFLIINILDVKSKSSNQNQMNFFIVCLLLVSVTFCSADVKYFSSIFRQGVHDCSPEKPFHSITVKKKKTNFSPKGSTRIMSRSRKSTFYGSFKRNSCNHENTMLR